MVLLCGNALGVQDKSSQKPYANLERLHHVSVTVRVDCGCEMECTSQHRQTSLENTMTNTLFCGCVNGLMLQKVSSNGKIVISGIFLPFSGDLQEVHGASIWIGCGVMTQ